MNSKTKNKNTIIAMAFILPSFLMLCIFMFYPLIRTIYLSFFNWNLISPNKKFVGLNNYIDLFKDPITFKVLNNTFLYIVILLAINFVVPYILAYILHSKIENRKNLFKSTIFLPSVISLVVGSMLYLWLLNPVSGPAGIIARMIGIEIPNWTKTEGLVIVVLSLITSWKVFGYNFIILYAGIMGVNQDVIETAIIDNVPSWKIFKDIILPMSSASGIYVFIITVVQGLQYVFIPIKVVTQGGPDYASSNLTYQSYHEAFTLYRVGPSSAFSVLTLIIFGLLLYLEYKYVEVGAYYEN